MVLGSAYSEMLGKQLWGTDEVTDNYNNFSPYSTCSQTILVHSSYLPSMHPNSIYAHFGTTQIIYLLTYLLISEQSQWITQPAVAGDWFCSVPRGQTRGVEWSHAVQQSLFGSTLLRCPIVTWPTLGHQSFLSSHAAVVPSLQSNTCVHVHCHAHSASSALREWCLGKS